jgi:hypothetical protein
LTTDEPVTAGVPRMLTIDIDGERVQVSGIVRAVRWRGHGSVVGFEFLPGQHQARAQLALGLFGMHHAPTAEPAGSTALTSAAIQAA